MVLSREIDAILQHLSYPYDLFVKVLFGCGLRLFEGLQLRVADFNFDAGKLLVHGKGKKDRTVPIPETLRDELRAQIKVIENCMTGIWRQGTTGYFWMMISKKNIPRHRRSLPTSGFSHSSH